MKREDFKIEICANSLESALVAVRGGADRIELCAGMPEGGTTPSLGTIETVRESVSARVHVIIRPRGGDFLYNELEQKVMLRDIEIARKARVEGVVLGCLTREGEVDVELMQKFMQAAKGVSVTFHRAFDMCRDPFKALTDLEALGCERILTSGQSVSAWEGVSLLQQLVARTKRVIIMPGCGVSANNIAEIARLTGASEFHLSGRTHIPSDMIYRNAGVSMGGTVRISEYSREVTSESQVRAAIEALEI